jgi:acyl-CoA synthetase (AMP-forming)/AMP-acid ligase II/acyl carrier protein
MKQDDNIKNIFLSQTIDERFSTVVEQFSDKVAYTDASHSVTFRQLSDKIDYIAGIIQNNFPDDIIGLYFEQSVEFITCLMGVIKSGKVVVPLEINSPENRLVRLFNNAKIKTIIKSDNLSFSDTNSSDINIITYSELIQKQSGSLSVCNDMNKELIILYTSGSTGEPKGVVHTHKSFMHSTYRFTKLWQLSPTDECTFLYSTASIGGIKDIINSLLTGSTLHYYSIEKNGYRDLPKWLEDKKITVYTSVVTVFRKLCGEIKGDLKHLNVRVVRLGGELSLKVDFDRYKEYFPDDCLFISGLASSETGLVRQNILTKDTQVTESFIANGYAVEDMEVSIRDEQGNILEDGSIGTIVISSDYLSIGYKNMPEFSAEKYRINSVTGKREYWSGDLGSIKEGNLIIAGRSDAQVKISGRRIDLSEIDSIVMDLQGVTNAAALYYEDTKSIVLFVEVAKNNTITKDELHKYLAANLPFYMQPTRVVILAKLPLTPNYKTNKKELYQLIKNYEQAYVEPTGQFETEVANVWCKILNKEKIGIHDNFFEIGGDSISAIAASTLLENIFNIKIPYGFLYQAQTVSNFAKAIEENSFNRSLQWLSLINQGSGIPIYWLLDGENALRKFLPDDQEIYRINTHYDHGVPNRNLTVELICEEFVKEILQVNKGDSCIVGGFSMGARFACEIAKQLKNTGKNIELLILLDPSESKTEERFLIGDTLDRIKSFYYTYTGSLPPDDFKKEHVFQFYKSLRRKYILPKYDGKVLLMQRLINVDLKDRDWVKITSPDNLIFGTVDTTEHLEVVNNSDIQLQWINKIKENIY